MKAQPKHKFYASLLDSFQNYLDTTPEEFFYQDETGWHKNYNEETGEFHFSDEEVEALSRQQLIDTINRTGTEVSEAADKGTCLNEIVDCILMHSPCNRDDIKIKSFSDLGYIVAEMDGFTFQFDTRMCKDLAEYFRNSICQYRTSATIETDYGLVELYGYIDYLRENKVFDLKTTKSYQFGKYEKKWQKHVYPYTLITSGKCTDIQEFEYTCVQLRGGTERTPVITGHMNPEVYTFDYEKSKALLKEQCERLIEFLNENRSLITDKQVFGGEKE